MTMKLNNFQHAVISMGILILILVLLYAVLILPAVSARAEFQDRFEEMQFQYSRFAGSENQLQRLQRELVQLKGMQLNLASFLEEKPQALAAAELQKHIKSLIESNNGNLISTQVIQQKENTEAFPPVTVKVHMRGNIESLQGILYRLATEHPVLLIDNLFLQTRNIAASRNLQRRGRVRHGADLIEARFEITGYIFQAETS